jgi:hypothetical protein
MNRPRLLRIHPSLSKEGAYSLPASHPPSWSRRSGTKCRGGYFDVGLSPTVLATFTHLA